jgi:hypothetical protein
MPSLILLNCASDMPQKSISPLARDDQRMCDELIRGWAKQSLLTTPPDPILELARLLFDSHVLNIFGCLSA